MTENKSRERGLWYTTKELAEAFFVTPRTVRRWVRAKLLMPRYRLRGGTCYEHVFLTSEVMRFMDAYLPTGRDLDNPTWSKTRSRKERADTIRRLQNLRKLYIGRINALHRVKEGGHKAKKEEPVILERPPRRRSNQAETSWDNEDEEED